MGKAALAGGLAFTLIISIVNTGLISAIGSNAFLWILLLVVLGGMMYFAYKAWEVLLVIATSAGGGLVICMCIMFLAGEPVNVIDAFVSPKNVMCSRSSCAFSAVGWVLLTLSGSLVQFKALKKTREEVEFEEAMTSNAELGVAPGSNLYKRKKELEIRKAHALQSLTEKAKAKKKKVVAASKGKYEKLDMAV